MDASERIVKETLETDAWQLRAVAKVGSDGQVASVAVPSKSIENGRWTVPRAVAASEVDVMLRTGATIAAISK